MMWRNRIAVAAALAGLALGQGVAAQDYQSFRGNSFRTGLPTLSPSTPLGTLPQVYNNPGQSFLRWWDPVQLQRNVIDTSELGTAATPLGDWTLPVAGFSPIAFNFIQNNITNPPYAFARTVPSLSATQPTLPAAGFTAATYSFTFVGLAAGQEFEVFLNVPIGPSDTDADPLVSTLAFPQRFLVAEVSGVVGGPFVQIVDIFASGGAFVQFGNDGNFTNDVFEVDAGGSITVTVFNTVPRSTAGGFLDPDADPGNELVYGDAAMIVGRAGTAGLYVASPIVSELTTPPLIGGAVQFPFRVVSARIENKFIGDLGRSYDVGVLTSFAHGGANVFDLLGTGRRNMVWNWPFRRPHDDSSAELVRAAGEVRDWVIGPNAANSRDLQRIQVDNLSGGSTSSGFFLPAAALLNHIGENYLAAPAVAGFPTSAVTWAPDMPEGGYTVQVWMPDADDGTTVVQTAQYEIVAGLIVIDTITHDQSGLGGWVTLSGQPAGGYPHSLAAPLSVRLTDQVITLSDVGRIVYADAVRFLRPSNLSVTSTPVQHPVTITLPGGGSAVRDVVVVATEDGRIYCIDAHGDPVTGDPPLVYWVYPSENTVTDPNRVLSEDGKDGIAEMPTGFDLSSALIQNIGGQHFLFIGTKNGRVYCLDMAGRGDGTTARNWTYPDDYNPTVPTAQIAPSTLGPIAGSIAFGTGAGGPTVYVPTTQGRIFALDALGSPVTKTTTVTWQFPPALGFPVGPITMAPAVSFGKVYFGAGTALSPTAGAFYAVDEATGLLSWASFSTPTGTYPLFGSSSPVAVPAAMLNGGGPFSFIDAVIFSDNLGRVVSLNAATGAFQWETSEIAAAAGGSLQFTYQTVFNNAGLLQANVPVVIVPAVNGRMVSLLADGSVNSAANRQVWGYALDGDAQVASIAAGGKTPVEASSWMYVGDSTGAFYAFNFDPLLFNQTISGGDPPGIREAPDNDPNAIDDILDDSIILLLVPSAYDDLFEKLQDGTLTHADITGAAAISAALRRSFEFGETLYVLVYNLPDPPDADNYFLQFQMSSGPRPARARQIQTRLIPAGVTPVGFERFVLTALPILPTGASGVVPGPASLQIRAVAPGRRGVRSTAKTIVFAVANPLALAFQNRIGTVVSSVGNVTNVLDSMVLANGNAGTDQDPSGASGIQPFTSLRPSLAAPLGDAVGHGTTGVSRALVIDRSLLNLIFGDNRGLQNVRFTAGDVVWVIDPADPTGGTFKPLTWNIGVVYPSSEDYPLFTPNVSLDYPDIGRDRFVVTKSVFGFVENPQFSRVSLVPPTITAFARSNYRIAGDTGYDGQMQRTLQPTIFELALNVPRYQPPSTAGYNGTHTVYVDSSRPGFDVAGGEPFRTFGTGLAVAVDERLSVGTPTVDLGSLPHGGGFDGGAAFGPLQPWILSSAFSPWNLAYTGGATRMFDEFQVFNDGNVNLLNVRVAKEFDELQLGSRVFRPVELFAPGLHELAWLDASLHLYSNLDPRFSATGLAGLDPEARNILQKARPGDVAPTQLSVNPRSRINPNLRGSGRLLMDPAAFPFPVPDDPKIGVTAPIGAPVGDYIRRIFAFEDTLFSNRRPDLPSLGQDESFADPGLNLKFTLRESRLTSRPTRKAAANVENFVSGAESFRFSSMTPTALRSALGSLFVAFTSDRVDAVNVPGWDPKVKAQVDAAARPLWRIYVTSLLFDSAVAPADTQSPIGDFNAWSQATADRWFQRAVPTAFPTSPPTAIFTLGIGETLDPTSVQYGAPAFPSSGAFDQLHFPSGAGRVGLTNRYMAFLGSATVSDAAGNRRTQEQLMITSLNFAANGAVTENGLASAMPFDLSSSKSKPSLVQTGGGDGANATVFYTTSSSGPGRINYSTFNGAWTTPGSLEMRSAFESVGAPSATLRRYRNADVAIIDVSFTARLRGRAFSEAFLTRMTADGAGVPLGDQPQIAFGPRIDELELDTATGIYWAPGAVWRMARNDLVIPNPLAPFDPTEEFIDVYRPNPAEPGGLESIVDKTTREFDRETGMLTYTTDLGGRVYVDTRTGSVRLAGALVPRSLRLFVRYAPTYVRVSSGPGANYRTVSMVYDDRFIGIYDDPANPVRSLLGDISYWGNEFNLSPATTDLLRWDRHVMTFTRTSGDGTQATRPFMLTLRFGLQLPTAIQLNPGNGALTSFEVQWIDSGGLPGSERFYQVDPATGRVFFMAGMEDRDVRIVYNAVDESGAPSGSISFQAKVGLLTELREEAVPIEQAGNESGMAIALDPLSFEFNRIDFRRPALYWMFWTSTRAGSPDVFFQTVAPRFTPRPPTP